MWQRDSHTVAVRWTLRCVPRLSPGRVAKPLALDGISEYRFDSRGFIREHSVRRLHQTITPISWRVHLLVPATFMRGTDTTHQPRVRWCLLRSRFTLVSHVGCKALSRVDICERPHPSKPWHNCMWRRRYRSGAFRPYLH